MANGDLSEQILPSDLPVGARRADRRTVAACFVEEALAPVRRMGAPIEPLLEAAGIALQDGALWKDGEPISAESYGRLWLQIARLTQDEFFGLGARPMRPGSFALMGHCVLHTKTLEQALRRALRFLRVVLDDPYGRLLVRDGVAEIVLADTDEPHSAFACRTFWLILLGLCCWIAGRRIALRFVDFRCAAPEGNAEYQLLFGASVRFGQAHDRVAFDASYLTLANTRTERMLKAFLKDAPANILVRYRYDGSVVGKVRAKLKEMHPNVWPNLDQMARSFRVSPSTLRQQLRQDGQSFQEIRDELRRDLAMKQLASSSDSISKIAADLGFAEPSAFYRAFRKWTGESPGTFRSRTATTA
ncbi:AraC family transcriptional regulator [Pseudochelatococcus contaminans]|uniref:AraC-like DNA-binding protein n=1 Tax=Pseudochelatococcus contaminans TaxID=1538103 RepID=A0A7W6EF39_9HYPH|nr:AraC family transcriptional regulator [Pseudochelatococcus contaminans]MBB3808579.1 AraC-like DNA-binding protein [Pseudochelatococcus contaminans]